MKKLKKLAIILFALLTALQIAVYPAAAANGFVEISIDVSGSGDTEQLFGAELVLYKNDGDGKLYYRWDETKGFSGEAVWVPSLSEATAVIPDNNDGTYEFCGLEPGVYFLKETNAPKGYNMFADDFEVDISSPDCNDWRAAALNSNIDRAASRVEDGIFYITLFQTEGTLLPSVRGRGSSLFKTSSSGGVLTAVIIALAIAVIAAIVAVIVLVTKSNKAKQMQAGANVPGSNASPNGCDHRENRNYQGGSGYTDKRN